MKAFRMQRNAVFPLEGLSGQPDTTDKKATHPVQVYKAMRPILQTMRISGILPKESKAFVRRFNPWTGFVVCFLHLYTCHTMCNFLTQLSRSGKFEWFAFFDNFANIIRSMTTMISVDHVFMRYQRLYQVHLRLENFPTFIEPSRLDKVRYWCLLLAIGAWVFVFIQGGLATWSLLNITIPDYFNWYFYGADHTKVSKELAYSLMILDWTLYVSLLISNEIMIKAYLMSTCLVIQERIKNFNAHLNSQQQQNIKATVVRTFHKYHTELSVIVSELDDIFSSCLFLWYASIILNICVKIQSIVSGLQSSDFSSFAYVITDVVYYSLTFLILSLVAAQVSEDAHATLPTVHRLAGVAPVTDWTFQQQTQLLVAKLTSPWIGFTGWNCFSISKSFVLTLIGSLITYTIVLLQMVGTSSVPLVVANSTRNESTTLLPE